MADDGQRQLSTEMAITDILAQSLRLGCCWNWSTEADLRHANPGHVKGLAMTQQQLRVGFMKPSMNHALAWGKDIGFEDSKNIATQLFLVFEIGKPRINQPGLKLKHFWLWRPIRGLCVFSTPAAPKPIYEQTMQFHSWATAKKHCFGRLITGSWSCYVTWRNPRFKLGHGMGLKAFITMLCHRWNWYEVRCCAPSYKQRIPTRQGTALLPYLWKVYMPRIRPALETKCERHVFIYCSLVHSEFPRNGTPLASITTTHWWKSTTVM